MVTAGDGLSKYREVGSAQKYDPLCSYRLTECIDDTPDLQPKLQLLLQEQMRGRALMEQQEAFRPSQESKATYRK